MSNNKYMESEEVDSSNNDDNINEMSEKEKRLFNIRLKMNQGRKANKTEVELEYKRLNDPKFEVKQAFYEKKKQNKESDDIPSENNEESKIDSKLNKYDELTAEQSLQWIEKEKKKEKNLRTFGWEAYTSDATYKAYKKSLSKLPTNNILDNNQIISNDAIKTIENDIIINKPTTVITEAALNRLGKSIDDKQKEREKLSRRRMHHDSTDVDYINTKNAQFNKKIKRAFDKYTVEIRQNLERGTAV